jgi:hypothetical protein
MQCASYRAACTQVNVGPTRADELASLLIPARVGEALPRLVDLLRAKD